MNKKNIIVGLLLIAAVGLAVIGMAYRGKGRVNPPVESPSSVLPYLEDGKLMLGEFLGKGNLILDLKSSVIHEGVQRIVHFNANVDKVLFLTKPGKELEDGDLWLADLREGESQMILSKCIGGQMSPDGKLLAIWSGDHKILVMNADGEQVQEIPGHGASPIFSHDGRLIAYEKLADESFDGYEQSLFEFAYGIAVYSLEDRETRILTDTEHGEDYAPIGFSADMQYLYFDSGRNDQGVLWGVDMGGKNLKQLSVENTSGDTIPAMSQNALWSSDRTLLISSVDNEITLLRFGVDRSVIEMKTLGQGSVLRWLSEEESLVTYDAKTGIGWQVLKIE